VDFVFWAWKDLTDMLESNRLHPILERGYYSLVDKDGLIARLPKPSGKGEVPSPPTAQQFEAEVRHFWYATYQAARYLARRDLWLVQYSLIRMRENMLTMFEWYAKSLNGWDYDTWHMGRFMHEWLDPNIYGSVYHAFGDFDAASSGGTLFKSMLLFQHVAKITAERLAFTYPADVDTFVNNYMRRLYQLQRLL
jgi:aminoglycoside 6-adenylyltransferase